MRTSVQATAHGVHWRPSRESTGRQHFGPQHNLSRLQRCAGLLDDPVKRQVSAWGRWAVQLTYVLALQADNRRFNRCRQSIRLPVRTVALIAERPGRRSPCSDRKSCNRSCRRSRTRRTAAPSSLLALEQAGDKPESLVNDVTLLPRHAPSCGGKVSPMRSE
jgi:hypothetical protein